MREVQVLDDVDANPEQRLIREVHVARGAIAAITSQRPAFGASQCGWVEQTDGEKVVAFDLTYMARTYRVFVVEVGGDGD